MKQGKKSKLTNEYISHVNNEQNNSFSGLRQTKELKQKLKTLI